MNKKQISLFLALILFFFISFSFAQTETSKPETLSKQEASSEKADDLYSGTKGMADIGITDDELMDIWLFYYKRPKPEKLILALKYVLNQDQIMSDKLQSETFEHFMASAAYKNPEILNKIKGLTAGYTGAQKDFLNNIAAQTENFVSPTPDSPGNLNLLWSEFFATGDLQPLKKIIDVLGIPVSTEASAQKTLSEKDKEASLLIIATEDSLKLNVKEHEKVAKAIKEAASSASGIKKTRLDKILLDINQ